MTNRKARNEIDAVLRRVAVIQCVLSAPGVLVPQEDIEVTEIIGDRGAATCAAGVVIVGVIKRYRDR